MQKRPPYLIRTVSRHGRVCWYVWRRPGPRIRIPGEYGSRAFMAAYRAALYGGETPAKRPEDEPETLAAMVAAYRRSPAWTGLALNTRLSRGNMLDRIVKKSGDMAVCEIDRTMIAAGRDSMSGPGAAKCFIDSLRGFFKWAMETGEVSEDPSREVKAPSCKTEGWETWTTADIAAYERRWPIGTRERLWLAVLLYTGLRLSDAIRLGPQHINGNAIEIVAKKNGAIVPIPLHPDLAAILKVSPLGKRSFIGVVEKTFGKNFRKACDAAGVTGSAHGVRKAAAAKLGEAGASVLELNSVFGWTGAKMALKYTDKADRARLARQAMQRLSMLPPSEGGNISP